MAPHLVRAQSAYKDIRVRSFYHTHTTNICMYGLGMGDGLVERKKKITDQYAEEKRWVFSFDLRE